MLNVLKYTLTYQRLPPNRVDRITLLHHRDNIRASYRLEVVKPFGLKLSQMFSDCAREPIS